MSIGSATDRRQPPPRLNSAQQDRAAGLLVGMAVGDSMASPAVNERFPRWCSSEITDRALLAAEVDQPEPFDHMEWPGSWEPYFLLALSSVSGDVLRDLHRTPEELYRLAQHLGASDAEEMDFRDAGALGEACALWAVMLQHAILTGEADLRVGLPFMKGSKSYEWNRQVADIERGLESSLGSDRPARMLQAAWSVVSSIGATKQSQRFLTGMQLGRSTKDECTVGPLVGAALGAIHGYSAIPWGWRRFLRDVRGDNMDHLMRSGVSAALGLEWPSDRWPEFQHVEPHESTAPTTVAHPSDPGVLLGNIGSLEETRAEAAVSLCCPGAKLWPPRGSSEDRAVFWLVDSDDPRDNPNLDFVLGDAARTILTLRKEGKTVLLHGLTGESRTPTVAAHYGALVSGRTVWEEFQLIARALPQTAPNAGFLRHLASVDARPAEVNERQAEEQAPFGHPAVDRQLIELLSWTIAAELLKKDHTDGWVTPMDGPEDGFAVLLGSARIEFLRAGAGITLNGKPFMTWPQVVAVGNPSLIVARVEAKLGLLFKGCVVLLTSVSTWKPEFAAGLVRAAYGRAATVRVQPLADSPEQRNNWGGMSGPPLLCTVGDESFVLERDDWIATGMLPGK